MTETSADFQQQRRSLEKAPALCSALLVLDFRHFFILPHSQGKHEGNKETNGDYSKQRFTRSSSVTWIRGWRDGTLNIRSEL